MITVDQVFFYAYPLKLVSKEISCGKSPKTKTIEQAPAETLCTLVTSAHNATLNQHKGTKQRHICIKLASSVKRSHKRQRTVNVSDRLLHKKVTTAKKPNPIPINCI